MNALYIEKDNFGSEDLLEALGNMGVYAKRQALPEMHDRVNERAQAVVEGWLGEKCPDGGGFDCCITFNYSPLVSNCCQKAGVKYVSWVYDSPLVSLFSYTIINSCNYCFVFDSALCQRFWNEGINTIHYMPLAANVKRLDAMHADEGIHKAYDGDIAFVGSMYNEKHNLYDRLSGMPDFAKGYLDGAIAAQMKVQGYFFLEEMLKGPVLEEMKKALDYKPNRDGVETAEYVYANYFLARKLAQREREHLLGLLSRDMCVSLYTHNPTPELPRVQNKGAVDYYDTMPYVFKCSKINLNISIRSIQSGIPLRCMDILGAGGFLMSNYQADLFTHFVPDEDFVYYEGDADLVDKCRYYLEHDDERQRIARSGHAKVAAEFTYEKLLGKMFRVAGLE
jgi:spore maturation protein CgeB